VGLGGVPADGETRAALGAEVLGAEPGVDDRDDGAFVEDGRRQEDRDEAARDELVDPAFVGAPALGIGRSKTSSGRTGSAVGQPEEGRRPGVTRTSPMKDQRFSASD
jgi:hypothetical protein